MFSSPLCPSEPFLHRSFSIAFSCLPPPTHTHIHASLTCCLFTMICCVVMASITPILKNICTVNILLLYYVWNITRNFREQHILSFPLFQWILLVTHTQLYSHIKFIASCITNGEWTRKSSRLIECHCATLVNDIDGKLE